MPERRVRLRVRRVGPRPPLPQVSSVGPPAQRPLQRFVRWYRRSDLAKHTAVLAAVVAAASLSITAWGTYKAAQVADDQLAQSREDDEKDKRAQASRISIWAEGEQPRRIVLANRSLDPAWAYLYVKPDPSSRVSQDVRDDVTVVGPGSEEVTVVRSNPGLELRLGVLPPCSRLDVPPAKLHEDIQKAFPSISFRSGKPSHELAGLGFRDTDGRTWARLVSGELVDTPLRDHVDYSGTWWMPSEQTIAWASDKDVKIKPLSDCGRAQ